MSRLAQRVERLEGGYAANKFAHLSDEELRAEFCKLLGDAQRFGSFTSPVSRARIEQARSGGKWFSDEDFAEIRAELQRIYV